MTHPADDYVPTPYRPDYTYLLYSAAVTGDEVAWAVLRGVSHLPPWRRIAAAAMAYNAAAMVALDGWAEAVA